MKMIGSLQLLLLFKNITVYVRFRSRTIQKGSEKVMLWDLAWSQTSSSCANSKSNHWLRSFLQSTDTASRRKTTNVSLYNQWNLLYRMIPFAASRDYHNGGKDQLFLPCNVFQKITKITLLANPEFHLHQLQSRYKPIYSRITFSITLW